MTFLWIFYHLASSLQSQFRDLLIRSGCRELYGIPENEWCSAAQLLAVWRRLPRTDSSNYERWRHSTTEARTSRRTPACGWTRRCCGSRRDPNCRNIPTDPPTTSRNNFSISCTPCPNKNWFCHLILTLFHSLYIFLRLRKIRRFFPRFPNILRITVL